MGCLHGEWRLLPGIGRNWIVWLNLSCQRSLLPSPQNHPTPLHFGKPSTHCLTPYKIQLFTAFKVFSSSEYKLREGTLFPILTLWVQDRAPCGIPNMGNKIGNFDQVLSFLYFTNLCSCCSPVGNALLITSLLKPSPSLTVYFKCHLRNYAGFSRLPIWI